MGGMCLSRDSNSFLIIAATWKCCRTPWSLLLWGVFSVCAGPDPPRPKWATCEVGAGGWTSALYRCHSHGVAQACVRHLKALYMGHKAWGMLGLHLCPSQRAAVVLWVGCLLSLSPLCREPTDPCTSWPPCQELVAQVPGFSEVCVLTQASHLLPATNRHQINLWYSRWGIFFAGVFHCGALVLLQLESRGNGGVAHLQDRGPGAGECMSHSFPQSWRQTKLWGYSLKS